MSNKLREGLNLAGIQFWTASILPALIGTTLPFWLRSPGFAFKPLLAVEFLLATTLFHTGFSFLSGWLEEKHTDIWPKKQILVFAGFCVGLSCLLGVHIHINLQLNVNVFESIFLVFGGCALFVGVLYVIPPVSFHRQVGGEIVLSYSLGLLPVLGAYLIQVGDITRRVYLTAIPVVVITGFWVWLHNLTNYAKDKQSGRKTLVSYLGVRFSGQVGLLAISLLFIFSLLLAVFSASLNPVALVSLLLAIPIWKIVKRAWNNFSDIDQMNRARNKALAIHFGACSIIAISSLAIRISLPFPTLSW